MQGVVQGAGRQSKGVLINFVAYYIAGLSSGLLLVCRLHWEVEGLVGGLILGWEGDSRSSDALDSCDDACDLLRYGCQARFRSPALSTLKIIS
ncbi:hypothetical protein WJX84_001217 [Apatococcus fuscideae]|uniref:Uncharacterized protein n=1 Tax=Apatococcus fuscideae TaxID=2026836 RepID=A0AAW1TD97_9CHLO